MVQQERRVTFSNLDRVLYPGPGISKKEVIEYYIRIAPLMIPYLQERPLTTRRFPEGVGSGGFYQKDAPRNIPEWVRTCTKDGIRYIICNDPETLVWLANLAAIEIHAPLSRIPSIDIPDMAYFDIDPEPPATFCDACRVAGLLKRVLDELHIHSYPKTSGKKGIHVAVPLRGGYTFREVRDFVHGIGRIMGDQDDQVRSELTDSREPATVFIDYLQNSSGKTMVCPYSLRAEPMATVSTPLEWSDLRGDLQPEDFHIGTIHSREVDPWNGIFTDPQEIVVR